MEKTHSDSRGPQTDELGNVNLLATERKDSIGRLIEERNVVSIDDLSELYSVSRVTVHRILNELESEGKVEKIRGGARVAYGPRLEKNYRVRLNSYVNEKRTIAMKARPLVRDGDTIFVDSSTTSVYLSRELTKIRDRQFTVITNSPIVASNLSAWENIRVIDTGGELLKPVNALVGPIAIASLKAVRFEKAFISCAALSLEQGMMTGTTQLAEVLNTVLDFCAEASLLVVSEKFGRVAPFSIAPLGKVDRIISDDRLPREVSRDLADSGIAVL